MVETYNTVNSLPFNKAAEAKWYLSTKTRSQTYTLSVRLNNGETYKFLESGKASIGDQVIIGYGGKTSYQMGTVEQVEKGVKVKRDDAIKPLLTFSIAPKSADISANADAIYDFTCIGDVHDCFKSMECNEGRFQVVDYLVKNVLGAITVIAFPELAGTDNVLKARAYLASEKPVPSLVFGSEYHNKYYSWDECSEVSFTGAYPGWEDDLMSFDFNAALGAEPHMDIRWDHEGYAYYMYFDGSDKLEGFFKDNRSFEEMTSKLVFKSALSILIRGGFVNLLQAALSTEMPVGGFYDELIGFADEIESVQCAALMKSIDYPKLVFEKVIYDESKADFEMDGTTVLKYKGKKETVTIPDGTETIGARAFQDNKSVKKVIMPGSVTQIGEKAFYGCFGLKEVEFSKNLVYIDNGCFYGCGLNNVIIPDSVTKIGDEAFVYCAEMEGLILGKGLLQIGKDCFMKCKKLKTVEIPESVVQIGNGAFMWCYELERVTFGGNLRSIGRDCFFRCEKLRRADLSLTKLEKLADSVFYGCEALTDVILPDSLCEIEESALEETSIAELTIPASVTSIWQGFGPTKKKPLTLTFEGVAPVRIRALSIGSGYGAVVRCKKGSDLWRALEELNLEIAQEAEERQWKDIKLLELVEI